MHSKRMRSSPRLARTENGLPIGMEKGNSESLAVPFGVAHFPPQQCSEHPGAQVGERKKR